MPVKALSFKGDKKTKKRKHREHDAEVAPAADGDPTTEDDETWTSPDAPSDITGPILLVLPTTPVTTLAADAHGIVFASQIENIVEGNVETAEPHDVRQVWVASRVVGTDQISFKGSHGGYLSCDCLGVLEARREARGLEEAFVVEAVPEEGETVRVGKVRWRIKTAASSSKEGEKGNRFLCAVTDTISKDEAQKKISISLRGDGSAQEASTELVVKMQARFKPRLQQNKETKAREKVSRQELEQVVGRRLDDDEVRRLKRARKDGRYYEEVLDVRVKGKHDKFA